MAGLAFLGDKQIAIKNEKQYVVLFLLILG